MPAIHFPVLIWPDAVGVTAVLVGDEQNAAAHASTGKEAMAHLKELLEWRVDNEPWNVECDMSQPELIEVKVEVRPQYTEKKRVIPCPETVWLRIPCVIGAQQNGLRLCAVPHLGLRFNYQDATALKSLAGHYVREALQGITPLRLASLLPPRDCRLEEIVVRNTSGRERHVPPADRPELKPLFAIADPLLLDLGRKRAASAAYGREGLAATLAHKLHGEKANVLLVGESGVGKSALLLDAAKRVRRENPARDEEEDEEQTRDLASYRFWRGSASRVIAGMPYLGEWEERCEEFVRQLNQIDGIFCPENLLELVQVGGAGTGDSVGAFLLPYLQRGELRMASEATPSEVEACRRLLPGLLDVFQVLHVPAFDDGHAIEVLNRVATACATTARLELEPGIIHLTHSLFKRFLPYAVFPGPAATFVRSLCERRHGAVRHAARITHQDVINQFTKLTGLPEIFLRDDLPLVFEELQAQFDTQIIGQSKATHAGASLLTTIKAGLADPRRPFGVLLFCGPTGVGKTALAKAMADFCFGAAGQKDRLVRLDLSEFSSLGAAGRLLQSANGKPAAWLERVRRQPFCVLLLDEIEKAAPEVFDVLLGLLDEGRLTDNFGRVTNFRSAIIILTSNLGSTAPASAGFAGDSGPAYESEVAKFFRPEFFNRLDAIITFNALTPEDVHAIARKELAELAAREGLASAGIRLEWSDRVISAIASEGYDHQLGARPLQRALERLVVTPLARWRVENPELRDVTLVMDLVGGELKVEAK